MPLRPFRLGLLAMVSMLATVLVVPNAGAATSPQTQHAPRNVNEQLAQYPGGTQVSVNEVSYGGGAAIVSFPKRYAILDCIGDRLRRSLGTEYSRMPRGRRGQSMVLLL